jgi:hypothetical protein
MDDNDLLAAVSCVDYAAMDNYMASYMASVAASGLRVTGGYAFVIHPAVPSGSKLLLDVVRDTRRHTARGTVTNVDGAKNVVTYVDGVGDRLWGFSVVYKGGISVSAGMGLVYASGNC